MNPDRSCLTTNRTFREWGTLFDVDNTLATALIDRLMHHGEALVIKGDSYRMKDTTARPTQRLTLRGASGRWRSRSSGP